MGDCMMDRCVWISTSGSVCVYVSTVIEKIYAHTCALGLKRTCDAKIIQVCALQTLHHGVPVC